MLYLFYLIEISWLLWRWICQKRLRAAAGLRAPEWTSIMLSPRSSAGDRRPVSRNGVVRHDTHFNASVNLTTLFACAAAFHTFLQMNQGGKKCCQKHTAFDSMSKALATLPVHMKSKVILTLWKTYCKAAIYSNVHLLLIFLPTLHAVVSKYEPLKLRLFPLKFWTLKGLESNAELCQCSTNPLDWQSVGKQTGYFRFYQLGPQNDEVCGDATWHSAQMTPQVIL